MMPGLPDNWDALTWEQKRQVRFDWCLDPQGIAFTSPEVKQTYLKRVQLFLDAIRLKKPERVPINSLMGFYVPKYSGFTSREVEYDYDKLGAAYKKFNQDFAFDSLVSSSSAGCGRLYDKIDLKSYNWPGRGIPENTSYQALEKEYMKADEYDALINDPSGYFLNTYFPRTLGAFEAFRMLPSFPFCMEIVCLGPTFIPMGMPPVQDAFKTMLEAGQITMEYFTAVRAIDAEVKATLGKSTLAGGFSKAPFDIIGDTLRGSRAIMLDMFRQPGKILEACERFTPLAVQWGVNSANATRNPCVIMPLHKGADGFMSQKDFDKFYWPSLKAVMKALINEGLVPVLFAEGGYNQRLDAIVDPELPAGSTYWMFDQTDMRQVKKKLGGYACFSGNIAASLISTGTPQQVRDTVRDLIENVGCDGGYILSTGAVIDEARPENLHAMIEAGLEYGRY